MRKGISKEDNQVPKKLEGAKYFLLFISFIIFISFIYATTWTTITESNFNEGTYYQTIYNASGFVQLSGTNTTGNYTSKIFDAGASATWNNISWTSGGYYQQELLSSQAVETGLGGANMSGNVLLMHFNNDSSVGENDTHVYDFSGGGNNGSVTDAVYNLTNKKLGSGAMEFDGDNDYVTIGTGSDFSNVCVNGCSFAGWVYVKADTYATLVGRWDYNNNFFVMYVDDSQRVRFQITDNGEPGVDGTQCTGLSTIGDVSLNEWSHIAGTWNTTNMYVYLNGIDVIATGQSCVITINETKWQESESTFIGITDDSSFTEDFNGTIDEVAIWNRSLSADEVLDIYKRGALELNLSVRSCNDAACSGESWSDIGNDTSPQDLSSAVNQYFQYNFEFNSNSTTYSPELYNVTLNYNVSYPITALNSPSDLTSTSNISITFNCSAEDDYELANITLYGNWSGGWHANETTSVSGTSNETTFTKTLTDGIYIWNCLVYDNDSNSDWGSNYTLTIDATSPSISNVTSAPTANTTLITWITDENTNSSISYGTTVDLTDGTNSSATLTTSHNLSLTNLTFNTFYYYNVTSCDLSNNCNESGPYNFTTLNNTGTIYYVDNTISDCSDYDPVTRTCGSGSSQAFDTIGEAEDAAIIPADTVYVRNGTYDERITCGYSGSVGNFINFVGYPWDEKPIMRGFDISNKSYIRIIGFEITHNSLTYNHGIAPTSSCSYLEILDNYIHDIQGHAIRWYNHNNSYITIRGNEMYMAGCPNDGNSSNCVGNGWAVQMVGGDHNLIEYNTIHRVGDFINVYTPHTIVRNNYMYDFNDSYWPGSAGGLHADMFQPTGMSTSQSQYQVYEANFMGDNVELNSHLLQMRSNLSGDHNIIFRRNVGYNYGSYPLQSGGVDNVSLFHNTWVDMNTQNPSGAGFGFNDESGDPSIGNYHFNNILYDVTDTASPYSITGSSNVTKSDNLCYISGADTACVSTSDPLFDNYANKDFHIANNSPARNIAKAITLVNNTDGTGTLFNVNNAMFFIDGYGIVNGDMIRVGSNNPVKIINITNNTITVDSTITWNNLDEIYFGHQDTTPDLGAYEYNSSGYSFGIEISNPVNEANVINSVNITTTPNNTGSIRYVMFYINGISVSKDKESPYSYVWDASGETDGSSHIIEVRAYNLYASGTLTISNKVNVTIGSSPTTTLNSPSNGSSTTNTSIIFNCSATDNSNLANITLYGSWSGGWHANETKTITGLSNSTIFTKILTEGNYIWNCLAYDNDSNSDWGNSNYSLIITSSSNGDTENGDNGGSSGGTTTTNVTEETHLWSTITPGVATIMKDFDEEIGIKQIQIEVNNEAQNVKITVTKHADKPAEVSVNKSGKVYKYLQIETENLEDKLNKSIITIQVEKNWTSENDVEKENMAMFRFNGSGEEWEELLTDYIEENETYYYYDVELDSFSYFAIAGKVVEEFEEDGEVGEGVGIIERIKELVKEIGKIINRFIEIIKPYWLWVLIGVGSVIIIVVGIILIMRRKVSRKKFLKNKKQGKE